TKKGGKASDSTKVKNGSRAKSASAQDRRARPAFSDKLGHTEHYHHTGQGPHAEGDPARPGEGIREEGVHLGASPLGREAPEAFGPGAHDVTQDEAHHDHQAKD